MTNEVVAQSSYRFLHILGNIVEISQKNIICYSPGLFRAGLASTEVTSNLNLLPDIFLKAMTVVSRMVFGYLGYKREDSSMSSSRPRVNTILHLFGSWLFQAALLDTEYSGWPSPSSSDPSFKSGRAEALGTLCIIFNSKHHNEEIEESYLARFYLAVQKSLEADIYVKCSTLNHFGSLMMKDLSGINMLVPVVTKTLQAFAEASLTEEKIQINVKTFRRNVLEVIKSLIPLTHHFAEMVPITFKSEKNTSANFQQLQKYVISILQQNLQVEQELESCQYLLGLTSSLLEHEIVFGEQKSNERLTNWTTSFLNLICYKLISTWSSDLPTCLATCEVITYIAASKVKLDELVCKRVLGWIGDFIQIQCNKPPPSHTRDLHSSIIAAFFTCQSLLVHFPFLLRDKESVNGVMEITELAISGSKSKNKTSDPPLFKEDKKLNPVSLRVSLAAEELLSTILQKVGYVPDTSLSEKCSTTINEMDILRDRNYILAPHHNPTHDFTYYLCDNNFILGISKESQPVSDPNENVSIKVLIRGPTCKTVWELNQRNSVQRECLNIEKQNKNKSQKKPEKQVKSNIEKPVISNSLPPVDVEDSFRYLETFSLSGNVIFMIFMFVHFIIFR